MRTVWKEIDEFPNYEINNLGEIRSKNRYIIKSNGVKIFREVRIIKQKISNRGYVCVRLHDMGGHTRSVHRLLAKAFIQNPENKPQVNHKDGNKLNNNLNNLEWVTGSENIQHAMKLFGKSHFAGGIIGNKGIKSHCHKKLAQYDLNGKLIKIWHGCREMQRNLGFNRQGIAYHIKNNTDSVYGYKWEFVK